MRNTQVPRLVALIFCLLLPATPAWAEPDTAAPETALDTVLALAPLKLSTDQLQRSAKADEVRRALIMQLSREALPEAGSEVSMFGHSTAWRTLEVGAASEAGPAVWVAHLETERFVRGHVLVSGLEQPELWLDGQRFAVDDGEVALDLAAGTHTLWLFHHGPETETSPALRWRGRAGHDRVETHIEPQRRVSARILTNAETAGSLAISPDGRYLAVSFRSRNDAADADLARLEIHDLEHDRIVRQWTTSPPRSLAWSPGSDRLAVHEGDHLWLHELDSGRARLLLANHERIGAWRWHPDGGSIVFAWTDPYSPTNEKRRRLRALEDRWATFRDNTQLFQVDAGSGLVRPLTARSSSVQLLDLHPDGDRALLSERLIDYAEPPHSLFRLFELDLDTLEEHEVGQYRQINAALFADEGYWLLAGPGLAQGDGATTGEDLTPNEYDTQLYRLSRDGERARSQSRDFDPALGAVHRLPGGDLLLSATAGETVALFRFDVEAGAFRGVNTGLELVEQFVASDGESPIVVARGTDVDSPQRIHRIDLNANRFEVLHDSRPGQYANVRLGEVLPWSFVNQSGDEIEGRYYLPPDFTPDAAYPLIVYYYGGTTPVNRQFTGRYPFHLWAAKGYVVYVLQPRGTIGYGQELSALHVNAWGRYTADDIIEGTRQFVDAHPFIDGERIGNIGASYGGFMTMHLATLTDLYAASISHAGISAITSYWGQGWWGYGYSGIASRGSFPWSNPELYVGQSPVYSADRITTPLLLVTGDSDTNVPPGESHNMFTALKLLGRDVELVEFPGEDHWILDREQRYVWWDTMLAWFDKWLKDEPQWWHHLYPETAPED